MKMINPIGTKTTRRDMINTMLIIVELEEFRMTFSGGLTFLEYELGFRIKLSGLISVIKGKI